MAEGKKPQLVRWNKRWRGRCKETGLSSDTSVLAYLEEALGLQDGASRRELAQSRRCLRGAGYRNNVNLKGVKKQEASWGTQRNPYKGNLWKLLDWEKRLVLQIHWEFCFQILFQLAS